ncbi:LLM class flavin-dependent oxidoreductase [Streptomyces kaempferi]|uniref:LLM class flavin-dependent oxidoreductase n=1 Tax=Streptomyces kaempferi TaxID=333725 RepID=A0ABW3XR52_9ACTN
MYPEHLEFGAFLSPMHPMGEDPTLQFERDLELAEHLDRLGYKEFWVGEHHSMGWNTIGSPELIVAAAASRTSRITLATGVTTLPYHHPFMVASRAVHLDHLTRGRFVLGVGAGGIPTDARMIGREMSELRGAFGEALEAVVELVNGEARVTKKTSWFTLQDAKLQLSPYRPEGLEIAAASVASGNSMRLAGRHGISTVSFGAPRPGHPRPDMHTQWAYAEESAAEHGKTVDRKNWRITLPVYVAETREQALRDVREGYDRWAYGYWGDIRGLDVSVAGVDRAQALEAAIEAGSVLVGSVDDVVGGIQRLREEVGGFGTLLVYAQDWADWEKTKRSYDLLARYVAPHFNGSTKRLYEAVDWYRGNRDLFPQLIP